MERVGQALAAEFFRGGKAKPAAFAIKVVGFLEALGYGDGAVLVTLAALLVAGKIDREEDLFCELCGLAEDRGRHVRRHIRKAGEIVVALDAEHVVEDEQGVVDRSLVDGHAFPRLDVLSGRAARQTRFPLCRARTGGGVRLGRMLPNFDVCVNVKLLAKRKFRSCLPPPQVTIGQEMAADRATINR